MGKSYFIIRSKKYLLVLFLFAILATCDLLKPVEKVEPDPYYTLNDTFSFLTSSFSPFDPSMVWPSATLWMISDSIFPHAHQIGLTIKYSSSDIEIELDSFFEPSGLVASVFSTARAIETVDFSEGTHQLIFINGNVENRFEYTAEDSALTVTPIESTFMLLVDHF